MTTIPTNIDSLLSTRLSGEKMLEYLTIKSQTADSSLDSLGLAWMYRDSVASINCIVLLLICSAIIVLAIVMLIDNLS